MSGKLRDIIRAVRACKTAAEERAVVQHECARIRQGFAAGNNRGRNMLKLLYISMLGFATEFGQMEVVKLCALPDFASKRVGYLTIGVLLDETHEVLTLTENHIHKDLCDDSQPFVQALALDAIANVAGADMSRDMMPGVLKVLTESTNTHLKKKAALAGVRIVRKVPDLAELFLEKMFNFMSERNHGVLIATLTLVNNCLESGAGAEFLPKYRSLIATSCVGLLRGLVLSSYAQEHDVNGVADPFLQVRLLQFLRITGTGDAAASDDMNDILAQVATNTDVGKNAGNAILYECVRTIAAIEADAGLRVLGLNVLGRFIVNKDNNVRFVALSSLLSVVETDRPSVQRHRLTVIECLKDVDLTIRRRSLQLIVALIDDENVRLMVPDLLAYLAVCADEVREETTRQLCDVVEKQSPSAEWRVEISLRLFRAGRSFIPESFALNFIALITQQDADAQKGVVTSLWEDLQLPFDPAMQARPAFLIAGLWLVGEFIDRLTAGRDAVFMEQVASTVATITTETANPVVKQYGLTALAKMATNCPVTAVLAQAVFDTAMGSMDCELQQRACEYSALLSTFGELAKVGFERMPPLIAETVDIEAPSAAPQRGEPAAVAAVAPAAPRADFMDDLFTSPTVPSASAGAAPAPVAVAKPADPFGDLFATPSAPAAPSPAAPSPAPVAVGDEIFSASDVSVRMTMKSGAGGLHDVSFHIRNATPQPFSNTAVLVAVPKTVTLDIKPLTVTSIAPGAVLEQAMTVDLKAAPKLMLKVKLVFHRGGQEATHVFQVSKDVPLF